MQETNLILFLAASLVVIFALLTGALFSAIVFFSGAGSRAAC